MRSHETLTKTLIFFQGYVGFLLLYHGYQSFDWYCCVVGATSHAASWILLSKYIGSRRTGSAYKQLARKQPCGCVTCYCENQTQCSGCGAKMCGGDKCVIRDLRYSHKTVWIEGYRMDAAESLFHSLCVIKENVMELECDCEKSFRNFPCSRCKIDKEFIKAGI